MCIDVYFDVKPTHIEFSVKWMRLFKAICFKEVLAVCECVSEVLDINMHAQNMAELIFIEL